MGQIITSGSMMTCSFGMSPCPFQAISASTVLSKTPVGTIQDTSLASIATFGMCSSLSNPSVSAATTAALGVLTPMPCLPLISGSWFPPQKILVKGSPILTSDSKCICAYGGNISFISSIQMNVIIK